MNKITPNAIETNLNFLSFILLNINCAQQGFEPCELSGLTVRHLLPFQSKALHYEVAGPGVEPGTQGYEP